MHSTKVALFFWLMLLIMGAFVSTVSGQTQQRAVDRNMNIQSTADTLSDAVNLVELDGDIILDEINIDAVIEKPRVSILPKRIDPEFGEMEFVDRSFNKELKSVPQRLMIEDGRLFQPNKIKRFKQNESSDKEKSTDK